jgi:lysophospholipase L1-like esterase
LSDGRYTAALNYLQYIAPQAFTSAIPDVMLILIGANDIGNGRNPQLVATNNVDTLLNIIFPTLRTSPWSWPRPSGRRITPGYLLMA